MGKRRIISHIVIGAIVGAVISLFNKETRTYAKDKITVLKDQINDVKEHPDKAVRTLRTAVEKVNHSLASSAENVLQTLDKVEDKLDK